MTVGNTPSDIETTDIGQFFSSLSPGDTVRVHFLDSCEETAGCLADVLERLLDQHGIGIEFLDGPLSQARHHVRRRQWFGNYRVTAFRILPHGSTAHLAMILGDHRVSLSRQAEQARNRIHIQS